jgi:hypothetical protein
MFPAMIRDACYDLCLNPLHHLHRVLAAEPKRLSDVVADSITERQNDLGVRPVGAVLSSQYVQSISRRGLLPESLPRKVLRGSSDY